LTLVHAAHKDRHGTDRSGVRRAQTALARDQPKSGLVRVIVRLRANPQGVQDAFALNGRDEFGKLLIFKEGTGIKTRLDRNPVKR
jgi:hypothetical protein